MNLKKKSKQLLTQGKEFTGNLIAQWKTPAKGNYVSYKEVFNFSVGGMGRDMVLMLVSYLGLGMGNTLFGSVLGIRPMHIQTMNTIMIILDIFFIAIRAKIVDNTNTKIGRFRPYIAIMPLPLFAIATTFVFLPFETMQYSQKIIMVFSFSMAIALLRPYFDGSISNLGSVITPNTKERTKVLAIFSILYSLAPTIYGFLIPTLSPLTGGYTDIRTYRYIMVPIALIGVGLSMFAAFGCKERFITPKGYKPKAKLLQSTMEVFKNKYWWIRTLSGWLAFMEWSVGNVFLWSFVYGSQDMTAYAVFNYFIGESALIAMLITPYLLNKWGNRKLIVIQNILNIVFLGFILLTFKQSFLLFIFWFLNNLVNSFAIIYKPVFTAEVNDYQHYISGKRLDGMMSFANQIGLPITIATGYFAPFVLESVGITTNYDILFEPMVRNNIFTILTSCSIIGAVLNLAPLFFYDYSHSKHRNVVRILRYRAMLSDYVEGNLASSTLKDALDGYYQYIEIEKAETPNLKRSKLRIKEAKALSKSTEEEKVLRKIAIKTAKKAYLNDKTLKEEKKESKMYYNEIHKYDKEELMNKVNIARGVFDKKIEDLHICSSAAVGVIGGNKAFQKLVIYDVKQQQKMAKTIKKYYPNGIIEPNKQDYIDAQKLPHASREEMNIRYKAIKEASIAQKRYNKAIDYYLRCKSLVVEYDSRVHFEVLEGMYEQAKIDVETDYRLAKEKDEQEKRDKKAEIERLKQLRFDKFSPKKQAKIIATRNKKAEKKAIKDDKRLNDDNKIEDTNVDKLLTNNQQTLNNKKEGNSDEEN